MIDLIDNDFVIDADAVERCDAALVTVSADLVPGLGRTAC